MIHFFRTRLKSFVYAFSGWGYVLRTQRNAWVHAAATLCVISLGLWIKISPRDWAVIVLTITLVWASEFINTALEAVVDLSTSEHHPLAKVGKDVGAAAVLIAALSAVLVGLLILGPPLIDKIKPFFLR